MNLKIYFIFMFICVNNLFAIAFNYSTTENIYESQKNINLFDSHKNIKNLLNMTTSTLKQLDEDIIRFTTEINTMESDPFSFSEASSNRTTASGNKTFVAMESSTNEINLGIKTNAPDKEVEDDEKEENEDSDK